MLSVLPKSLTQAGAVLKSAPVAKPLAAPKFSGNTITVMGNGFVSKNPDRSRMTLSINEEGKDKAAVSKKVAEKAEALTAAVKLVNAEFDLSSTGVRVHEKTYYDQQTGKHKKDGYTATFQLTVTDKSADVADLKSRAAQVNEVAVQQGSNFGGAFGFLSERRQAAGAREALSMAYTDALKKAGKIAKTAGHALETLPVSVVENGAQQADFGGRSHAKMAMAAPMGGRAMMEAADAGVSEELFNFAPQTISAPTITVVYQIKDQTPAAPAGGGCEGPTCGAGKLDARA